MVAILTSKYCTGHCPLVGMGKGGGDCQFSLRPRALQKLQPIVLLAAVLSLLAVFVSLKVAVSCILSDASTFGTQRLPSARIPEDVSLALLHFATTKEVPQQSEEEISVTMKILMERGPSNFLVFGLWDDSLLWATFNYGGRTAFLDESQKWIDRTKAKHPQLETYKVDYRTTLSDSSNLLATSRELRNTDCRANQYIANSSCPLALTTSNGLPEELLSVEWDVIMIDGPRSYHLNLSFPGRMSAIFTSSVMARSRSGVGNVDILLHDVPRDVESEYAREFLCMDNQVRTVGNLSHFRVHPSSSQDFC